MLTLLALVAGPFVFEHLGYWVHRLLHSPTSGPLHRAHMHHHDLYPPEEFLSPSYRRVAGTNQLRLFAPFVVAAALLVVWLLPLWLALGLLLELAVVAWVNTTVHDALHVDGHFLEHVPLFCEWRELHLLHHEHPRMNYGIVTFLTDRLLGTFVGGRR